MRKNKVDIITLGCSKNLVDSEQLMRQFVANGYTVEHDPHKINGEIVVVNTCGFIGDAQEESINMILDLGEAKKKGKKSVNCLSWDVFPNGSEKTWRMSCRKSTVSYGKVQLERTVDAFWVNPTTGNRLADRVLTTPLGITPT